MNKQILFWYHMPSSLLYINLIKSFLHTRNHITLHHSLQHENTKRSKMSDKTTNPSSPTPKTSSPVQPKTSQSVPSPSTPTSTPTVITKHEILPLARGGHINRFTISSPTTGTHVFSTLASKEDIQRFIDKNPGTLEEHIQMIVNVKDERLGVVIDFLQINTR